MFVQVLRQSFILEASSFKGPLALFSGESRTIKQRGLMRESELQSPFTLSEDRTSKEMQRSVMLGAEVMIVRIATRYTITASQS
jgi:hypothetical protein